MRRARTLADLDRQDPGLRFRMGAAACEHVRIFVNGVAIGDLDVAVSDKDEARILQALSGG